MAQYADEAAAGDANEPVDTAGEKTPFEDFADALGLEEDGSEPEEEEEEDLGEDEEPAEEEEEAEEPEEELPAIDPPNSLTAEEKEAFKNLPREAQEFTARRIGELEKGFQRKAEEAAHTRQAVENEARQAIAQLQQQAAAELQQYADLIAPQKPDPSYYPDWQSYSTAQAHYEALVAQRGQAQQRAQEYAAQAQAQQATIEQAEMAREVEILKSAFPEWYAPETSANLQNELTAIAKELGYSDEHVQHARATDILAMRKAAEWKAKAEKLDAVNKTKMEKVREAKTLPKVTKPGVAHGTPSKQARAEASWQAARKATSRVEREAAFGDFLDKAGYL